MTCQFCAIAQNAVDKPQLEDTVIAESASFFAKPGLGHFSRGYSLICTRQHVRSFSLLPTGQLAELEYVTRIVRARLEHLYDCKVVVFEHGGCSSLPAGSCVDHAHLHLLPLPTGTPASVSLRARFVPTLRLEQLASLRGQSYLYIDSGDRKGAYTLSEPLPSQYARRVFCERLGISDYWDWGVFLFRDRIADFMNSYWRMSQSAGWETFIDVTELPRAAGCSRGNLEAAL